MTWTQRADGTQTIRLRDIAPDADGGLRKAEGKAKAAALGAEVSELQELLFAAGQKALLIVMQGMDTGGKDGAIRHLSCWLNIQGCRVVPFGFPTAQELAHDFLWRVHAHTPPRGRVAIFNRSHYEDVLVVRVRGLAPPEVWQRRYDHINHFEQLLADSDTLILKFFLHISKEEQQERLLAREQEPRKAWKLAVGDWADRALWDDYMAAYEDAINRCSAPHAPWHIVPADRKWFRNLAVTAAIRDALWPYRDGWLAHLAEVGQRAKAELAAYRQDKTP